MRRHAVSLGDAIRAVADLEPRDAATREAIVLMLGLEHEATTPAIRSIGAWKLSSTDSVITAQRQEEPRERFEPPVRPPESHVSPTGRSALPSGIRKIRTGHGVFKPPDWLAGDGLDSVAMSGPPPAMPPLFGRLWRRGILTAALATSVPEGDLDLGRILKVLGNGRPLEALPRLPSPTLRRGVQVLIDRSTGMDPFRHDQDDLVRDLDDILADDRLEVLYFTGCPLRGTGPGPRSGWGPWRPPPSGTPVLAATDLGIGGRALDDDRAMPGEWLDFAHRVRSAGHLLVALVPYEALRWPAALGRAMAIIHWSERTTVGQTRRTMREAWHRLSYRRS